MARFFHTLVVFGACATLARCGGKTLQSDEEASDAGPDGSSTGGGPPATDAGPSFADAGVGGGSAVGGGGGIVGGSGGTGGSGGLINTGGFGATLASDLPPLGPEAQWNCSGQIGECALRGTIIEEPCPVESWRPVSPEQCASGERLRCQLVELEGRELLVGCECVTREAVPLRCGCEIDGCDHPKFTSCDDHLGVCGCLALACIAR